MRDRALGRVAVGDLVSRGATIAGLVAVQRRVAGLLQSRRIQPLLFVRDRQIFDRAGTTGLADCDSASLMTNYLPSGSQLPDDIREAVWPAIEQDRAP